MAESLYSHDEIARRDEPARKQRAAFARGLRSASGGPPTDNRRVQADAVKGEVYLAIATVANAVQGVTATVTQLRQNRRLRRMHKARVRRTLRHAIRHGVVTKAMPTPDANANDKQRKPLLGGPLVKLFERPNAQQTLAAFLALWRLQEMLTGNVLVWCNPDGAGRVREMFVLPTALCVWQPASPQYPRGAWRVHQPSYGLTYGMAGGSAVIPAEQVVHHKHLGHPLYHWDGLSPLTGVSKWVDVIEAIDRSCWSSMMNGVERGLTIVVPGMSADEAREQSDHINRDKAGPDNARRVLILGSNNPDSKPEFHDPDSAREMDFQSSRQNYASLVLAAMGVPPIVANLKEAGSHAQLYASLKQFRDLTLIPWLAAVAAALNAGVVATWDDGDDGLKVQFDVQSILNEDLAEASKTRQTSNGITTANEDRRADNLPPHPDPKADELPTSLFNEYLKQKHMPPPPPASPDGGQPGAAGGDQGGAGPQSADDMLAGLGGDGPDAGDAPQPENDAGAGSLPPRGPQAKAFDPRARFAAWVEKARAKAGDGKREGEVWQTNGRYYTLKNGRTVPAPNPNRGTPAPRAKKEPPPKVDKKAEKAGAKGKALEAAKAALADPSTADPAALAEALKGLDVAALKQLKADAGFKGGSTKSELAQRFIDHVKAKANPPAPKPAAAPKAAPKAAPQQPEAHPLAASLADAIGTTDGLGDEQRAAYTAAAHAVVAVMPKAAADRAAKAVKKTAAYPSTDHLLDGLIATAQQPATQQFLAQVKAKKQTVGGAMDKYGTLHIDGGYTSGQKGRHAAGAGTTAGIYAHELTHAIDGGNELSGTPEWSAAFDAEIKWAKGSEGTPPLTGYAGTKSSEGFAEFGRLLYGSDVPTAAIKKDFPKASAFFAARGLFPAERGGGTKKLDEVFDQRVPLDGGAHADTLLAAATADPHGATRAAMDALGVPHAHLSDEALHAGLKALGGKAPAKPKAPPREKKPDPKADADAIRRLVESQDV